MNTFSFILLLITLLATIPATQAGYMGPEHLFLGSAMMIKVQNGFNWIIDKAYASSKVKEQLLAMEVQVNDLTEKLEKETATKIDLQGQVIEKDKTITRETDLNSGNSSCVQSTGNQFMKKIYIYFLVH